MFQINVSSFDSKQFLGPASCFPRDGQQVLKRLVPYQSHYGVELILANDFIAATSLRLFDKFKWIRVDVPHLDCPARMALDCNDASLSMGVRPIRMIVNSLLNVVWMKLTNGQIANGSEKPLSSLQIPLVRPLRTVPHGPIKEQVNDRSDRFRWHFAFLRLRHHLMEALERQLSIWSKIVPSTINRDEPRPAIFSIPRLR